MKPPSMRTTISCNAVPQPVRLSFARAKKLPRAAECLVYSLTPSGVLDGKPPKNRGFVGILRGQKCLKRRFSRRSPVGEWSRGARSMPRVFGRGSRSQPAALVSDRDECSFISGDPDPRDRQRHDRLVDSKPCLRLRHLFWADKRDVQGNHVLLHPLSLFSFYKGLQVSR